MLLRTPTRCVQAPQLGVDQGGDRGGLPPGVAGEDGLRLPDHRVLEPIPDERGRVPVFSQDDIYSRIDLAGHPCHPFDYIRTYVRESELTMRLRHLRIKDTVGRGVGTSE